jgi:hypothetical protein
MYERMSDKNRKPDEAAIQAWLGHESCKLLAAMEAHLESRYQLCREVRIPFGKSYGWGYKYSHKSSHLCYAFFEKGAFTVTLQIGDGQTGLVEEALPHLLPKTRDVWDNRYPCGESGGWVHYRVVTAEELDDVQSLVSIKKKPAKTETAPCRKS